MAKREEHIEEFIELRIQGWSYDKIAQHLNVSKPTLIKWNADQEVKRVIDIGKLARLEAIIKKYELYKEATLEQNAIVLRKLRQELGGRDFSEVPTEKLMKLVSDLETNIFKGIQNKEVQLSSSWITEEKIKIDPFE